MSPRPCTSRSCCGGYGDGAVVRPDDLPDYEQPPVDEVVIGVQFPAIQGFSEPHMGLFWQRVRDEFPRVESKPRLEGAPEDLSPDAPAAPPAFVLSLEQSMPGGRVWLISEPEDFLLQIQNTRFILNWRKRAGDYPHFEALSERFWSLFTEFRRFLAAEPLADAEVEQLEVSYINWIPDMSMSTFFRPAEAAAIRIPGVDQGPEEQLYRARYLATDDNGDRIGRFHVLCQPAVRVDQASAPQHGSQLSVSFKAPGEALTDDTLRALSEVGRNGIVRAFTELTTSSAHEVWRRIK